MRHTVNSTGLFVTIFILVLLAPFAYIWAWNTLFGALYFIETNFWTWLAVLLFTGIFGRRVTAK